MERHAERLRLLLVRHRRLDRLHAAGELDAVRSRAARRTTLRRGPPRSAPARATADVQRLDRHRLAVGEPQPLRDHDRLRRRDVQRATEMRAGHRRRVTDERPAAGAHPTPRMSSLNDVIVSSCAIFGSRTKVPAPRRRASKPSRTRSSSAARTVRRDTPRSTHSCRSDGIACRRRPPSSNSRTRSRVWLCFVVLCSCVTGAMLPGSGSKWSIPLSLSPADVVLDSRSMERLVPADRAARRRAGRSRPARAPRAWSSWSTTRTRKVAPAVRRSAAPLARRSTRSSPACERGGRLVYAGAGTSGRLASSTRRSARRRSAAAGTGRGVARRRRPTRPRRPDDDAARAPPTSPRPESTRATPSCVLSASGRRRTPLGAARAAAAAGALVVAVVCAAGSALGRLADHEVVAEVGPEVIAGSTRMKAGTAQKLVLNTISTLTMVRLGKTFGNLMVDVVAANAKLRERSRRAVALAPRASPTSTPARRWRRRRQREGRDRVPPRRRRPGGGAAPARGGGRRRAPRARHVSVTGSASRPPRRWRARAGRRRGRRRARSSRSAGRRPRARPCGPRVRRPAGERVRRSRLRHGRPRRVPAGARRCSRRA